MKILRLPLLLFLLFACVVACRTAARSGSAPTIPSPNTPSVEVAVTNSMPVIHVFVALCDNVNQGIVPVSATLGNGDNPKTNLYWGAGFGVKTFFSRNKEWQLVSCAAGADPAVLERCIFKHRQRDLYLIADAYRGKEIAQATWDFLESAAGRSGTPIEVKQGKQAVTIHSNGSADVLAYVGHNGLMDFKLKSHAAGRDARKRKAIMLACASKPYFKSELESTGAEPLLWTTNLMAPEAYVLSAALDGWIARESNEQIRLRAAGAYDKYQHCGLKAASRLFATGW